ncbi:MAG: hypothetical protein IPL98_13605 [Saprospiraceae bacterium]|nr:hypothetical protein [Saprospiraceae bacterium]
MKGRLVFGLNCQSKNRWSFMMVVQEVKVIKNWNVGIYKPEGLGQMTNFDTTYGLYFDMEV